MLGVARRAVGALGTAAGRAGRAQAPQVWQSVPAACQLEARRGYRHWWRVLPEDFELNTESMPKDVKSLMASNPYNLGFIDAYWYWRIRAESTIMDPENLPKKSYKQLCRDMGLTIVNEAAENILGVIELYEYLKSSPFIGPFGTIENPVLVPAIHTERVVGCTGGTGDNEHVPLWFRCREGFLYRCGECDQIFMLVRVLYELPEEGAEINPIDPDVKDVFDFALLEKGNEVWNTGGFINWPTGYDALHGTELGGKARDEDQRAIGEWGHHKSAASLAVDHALVALQLLRWYIERFLGRRSATEEDGKKTLFLWLTLAVLMLTWVELSVHFERAEMILDLSVWICILL